MTRGWRGRGALAAVTLAAALTGVQAALGQDPGNPICLKQGEETPEIYGPTDIGATLANEHVSVAENAEGTLSVLRWPSRSYWEQLKYFTVDRDQPRLGLNPNEGAFSGLALTLRDGTRKTIWLRDLKRIRQRYASEDSDTVITRYRSPRHRFRIEIVDVVPRRGDVLIRRHLLRPGRRSDVRSADLIAFANLNPTASKRPLLPTEDWCEEVRGTDLARYRPAPDALVYEISEVDQSTGRPRSVGIAIGANRRSIGHQVGADPYTDRPVAAGAPESAYDDAADGRLSGNGSYGPAEVDAALAYRLGRRPVKLVFALAEDATEAVAELDFHRDLNVVREAKRKRRSYLRWLAEAPLPRGAPPALERLARRALVSLRQAIDVNAGADGRKVAIMASLSTQAPYYLDWIRDGAFFNEALDLIGHHRLVTAHNRFYAEVQHKLEEGAPPGNPALTCASPTPDGNWFMTNYADGGDAGIFPWEIDEAGFGLWTLWRHYEVMARQGHRRARAYLEEIYPALRRTAEFLVAFRDPTTGLAPGTACEDDNAPRQGQPTMHSSGPVLLAMRSAERAARTLGRDADASRYSKRRAELEAAIDSHHRVEGGAWTADFGDGGWALWPVRVKPYRHPRSRAQAELAWQGVKPRFLAPDGPVKRGQYEVKALHGMAWAYRKVTPRKMRRVRRGLRWIAEVQAAYQKTGILGEAWYVRDGELISVVAQPHVWEQILVYLASVRAYGRERYHPGERERPMRRGR